MPIDRGYTMIQITYEGRELLRELAYARHKPMYEALVEVLREAVARDKEGKNATNLSVSRND